MEYTKRIKLYSGKSKRREAIAMEDLLKQYKSEAKRIREELRKLREERPKKSSGPYSPFFTLEESTLILSENNLKKQLATVNQQIKYLKENGNLLQSAHRVKLIK
jgi:hypothetical protein